jgi:hypothetical protein
MDRKLLAVVFRHKLKISGLKIQSPKSMVREQWFLDAIEDAPDYLFVSTHSSKYSS